MNSTKKYLFTADVRHAAKGRWLDILSALAGRQLELFLPGGKYKLGQHGPCPEHGGRDGFRLFRDADETGGGVCNTCGNFKDGFAILQWLQPDKRFPELVEEVADVLGMSVEDDKPSVKPAARFAPAKPTQPKVVKAQVVGKSKASDEFLRHLLQETWQQTIPVTNAAAKPLQRYLRNRGLSERLVARIPVLRFHPALPYLNEDGKEEDRWPAMVAMFTDPSGKPVTLHRTYLTTLGEKAPVQTAKKLMAYPSDRNMAGGALRLSPLGGQVLGVAEGIETALSVIQSTGTPVWAGLTAVLTERITPPENIRAVVHWADLDRSGRGAEVGKFLSERLKERGVSVKSVYPGLPITPDAKSVDWNDVLLKHGITGFQIGMPRLLRPQAA